MPRCDSSSWMLSPQLVTIEREAATPAYIEEEDHVH